jgi:rhamnosyltransferase subunit B
LDSLASSKKSPLIIIATAGTGGDIFPFITIARGLHQRGHRVLMVIPAFQEHTLQGTGLSYQTFGTLEEGKAVFSHPDVWDASKGWGIIWAGFVPHLDVIREVVLRLPSDEPCTVLCHTMLVPMAALARAVRPDLRIVSAFLAPSSMCSSYDMLTVGPMRIPSGLPLSWRQSLWKMIHRIWTNPASGPSLNDARARYQLPPVQHFFEHMMSAANASLGCFPTWFATPQPDWPQPFIQGDFVADEPSKTEVSFSAELEHFLSVAEPPIVFTAGTGHRHAAQYFNTALRVMQRQGRRGLFVTPYPEQLPVSLPDNILWQAHVPFSVLLPRVAAIVHHGGVGTTAAAFRAGIPQLIVPFAYDQFDNGLRVKRLGVGTVLPSKSLSVRRMSKQLMALLTAEQTQINCNKVACEISQSELNQLLKKVEIALCIEAEAPISF